MSQKLQEILLGTNNKGKITELEAMLKPFDIKVKTVADFDLIDPEETGTTFLENAKLKALYFAKETGLPALADDSGLCIEALDNRPGVYTARFAPTPFEGMTRIIKELENQSNRKAFFTCCLVLAYPDGKWESFEGFVHGTIATKPQGEKGFAYDPIFIPDGFKKTFGEMEKHEKASLSHRGNALKLFADKILVTSD